jgi:Flp pilus assembly protein TadG
VRSDRSKSRVPPGPQSGFLGDDRGSSVVEIALILPPALLMLALAVMAGQGFEIERKASLAARTVTDLVSQAPYVSNPAVTGATELNQSVLDADLALSALIMWPDASSAVRVVVSELSVNSANNTGTVVWSEPYNGATALAVGKVVSLSPSYAATGAAYLIYGQVQYSFQPLQIMQAVSAITFNEGDVLAPRNASRLTINWGQ